MKIRLATSWPTN